MGYEVNLILLEKHENAIKFDGDREYGSVVSTMDLCKIDNWVVTAITEAEVDEGVPVSFFLPGDGNKSITSDMYDKGMVAFPAERMLIILNGCKEKPLYRRYAMAKPLLKEFVKRFGKNAWVACYGH